MASFIRRFKKKTKPKATATAHDNKPQLDQPEPGTEPEANNSDSTISASAAQDAKPALSQTKVNSPNADYTNTSTDTPQHATSRTPGTQEQHTKTTADHSTVANTTQSTKPAYTDTSTSIHTESSHTPHTHTASKPTTETSTGHQPQAKRGWFSRLRQGLKKTRQQLGSNIANALLGKPTVDAALLESISDILLQADLGMDTSERIIAQAKAQLSRQEIQNGTALFDAIKCVMLDILKPCQQTLSLGQAKANCILMIGVNGAGKTTSIAKLAHYFQQQKQQVILAAGDTFRAAAVEQLQSWGKRQDIPVIAQHAGADSAAVIYDAMQACQARNYDVLLADTAGRLHTQSHLLSELEKVKRVMAKLDPQAPHHTLLVVDATAGQNALVQAKEFNQHIGVDGIILSKLDSSAKGGMIFAIAHELQLPIYFIGVGEAIEDLQAFEPQSFIDSLFSNENTASE